MVLFKEIDTAIYCCFPCMLNACGYMESLTYNCFAPFMCSIKVLDERPAAMITLQEGILLTCVSWSPHEHMLLACGATDGSVSLWQLQPSSSHDDEGSKDLLLTPIPVQILLDISRV